MNEKTDRERIRKELRYTSQTPTSLAEQFKEKTASDILDDIKHIKKTLRSEDETLHVRPPECMECEFNNFDNLLNIPTKCPNCRSRGIREPVFKVS